MISLSFYNPTISIKLMMIFIAAAIFSLAQLGFFAVNACAYDTAPRISDREIVESLTELKEGQKSLNKRLDDMNEHFNKRLDLMTQSSNTRFEAIDKRFESIDKRFESIDKRFEAIDKRFEAIDKRFDDLEQKFNARFSELQNLILTLYGAVMALIIALIGYMIWDRKTAQEPLKVRLGKVETDIVVIEEQLDIRNPSGTVVVRLIATLRKLAETDERVAAILRSYSLL